MYCRLLVNNPPTSVGLFEGDLVGVLCPSTVYIRGPMFQENHALILAHWDGFAVVSCPVPMKRQSTKDAKMPYGLMPALLNAFFWRLAHEVVAKVQDESFWNPPEPPEPSMGFLIVQ